MRITLRSSFAQARRLSHWSGFGLKRCLLCGAITRERFSLCVPCTADLPYERGDLLPLKRKDALDALWVAFDYRFPVDHWIHAFKFRGDLVAGQVLAALMTDAFARHAPPRPDLLVPIPLHWSRLCRRGYNPSQLLAARLSHAFDITLAHRIARRIKRGAPQTSLAGSARTRNLADVFVVDADLTRQRVAIVDDVVTTGSTVNALASKLKASGCSTVDVWGLAQAG
jgi:ComF family protein